MRNKRIEIKISVDEAEMLDMQRGELSRGEYIRKLLWGGKGEGWRRKWSGVVVGDVVRNSTDVVEVREYGGPVVRAEAGVTEDGGTFDDWVRDTGILGVMSPEEARDFYLDLASATPEELADFYQKLSVATAKLVKKEDKISKK